jgi:phage-related protein
MAWTVSTLNEIVDAEVEALPADLRARLARLLEIVEEHGLAALPRDAVEHLEDKLWELRIRAKSGISRAIYVTAVGQRVVIVRVFVKKTQKTPIRELRLARERAKDV